MNVKATDRPDQRSSGSVVFSVLLILLLIGGIEWNPGPGKRGLHHSSRTFAPAGASHTQTSMDGYIRDGNPAIASETSVLRRNLVPEKNSTSGNPVTASDVTTEDEDSVRSILLAFRSDFSTRMDVMDKNFAQFRKDINAHTQELHLVKKEIQDIKSNSSRANYQLNCLEAQIMRLDKLSKETNIVFRGFEPFNDVSTEGCIEAVDWLINKRLQIDNAYITSASLISRTDAHAYNIVATIPEKTVRDKIFSAAKRLKGSSFFVQKDFTLPERRIRSQLLKHRRQALDRGARATLVGFNLFIDDKRFRLQNDQLVECDPPARQNERASPVQPALQLRQAPGLLTHSPHSPRDLLLEEDAPSPNVTNSSN